MTEPATLNPAIPDSTIDLAITLLRETDARDITLATAESCTGGLLASLLTDVEGLSHCFERGFVCYSETSKCDQLGLDQGEIDRHGAVSRSVAIAMAEGALARSNAEIAFAVTGFAGRGEEGDEPGLVHFACARHGGPTRHDEMPLRRHWPRRRPAKNRPPRGGNDARCGDALTAGQHCRPSRGC